eukprot:COSAG01_NODE_40_length_32708_cov_25.641234_28_plen_129_part_00
MPPPTWALPDRLCGGASARWRCRTAMRGSPVPQRRHMGLCGAGAAEVLSAVLPKTKSLFWAYKKGQIRISSPPGLHAWLVRRKCGLVTTGVEPSVKPPNGTTAHRGSAPRTYNAPHSVPAQQHSAGPD